MTLDNASRVMDAKIQATLSGRQRRASHVFDDPLIAEAIADLELAHSPTAWRQAVAGLVFVLALRAPAGGGADWLTRILHLEARLLAGPTPRNGRAPHDFRATQDARLLRHMHRNGCTIADAARTLQKAFGGEDSANLKRARRAADRGGFIPLPNRPYGRRR